MSTQSRIYSIVTNAGPAMLVRETLPDEWLEVHLFLNTAGPVVVGEQEDLMPVSASKGLDLPFQVSMTFKLSPSSKLFLASTGVNTVSVRINAIPGLEQILKMIGKSASVPEPTRKATVTEQVDIGRWGFQMPTKK